MKTSVLVLFDSTGHKESRSPLMECYVVVVFSMKVYMSINIIAFMTSIKL